jgi:hypothetical protein
MTVDEAFEAYEHADDIARSCDELDALDEASNHTAAMANCPAQFNPEQREFAARILSSKYMAAIGRC